jgi:phosphate transport system substrate-binding protein
MDISKNGHGSRTVAFFLLILLCLIPAAGCARNDGGTVLNVSGSSTILPLVTAAAAAYEEKYPGFKVGVQGGGSSAGIEAAITGASQIGTSSRDLKGFETKQGLVDTVIAIDAIAIIVNPSNRVHTLSQKQVTDIFTGKVVNWKEVGGADLPIVLINRDEASGTREAFGKKVLAGAVFSKDAVVQPGSGQVRSIVGSTPAAIGYMSLGYVTKDVKVIKYDGVIPSKATLKKGTYKLQRELHFFTKGKPTGDAKKFVDYVLSDYVQDKIVSVEFIPVKAIGKQ